MTRSISEAYGLNPGLRSSQSHAAPYPVACDDALAPCANNSPTELPPMRARNMVLPSWVATKGGSRCVGLLRSQYLSAPWVQRLPSPLIAPGHASLPARQAAGYADLAKNKQAKSTVVVQAHHRWVTEVQVTGVRVGSKTTFEPADVDVRPGLQIPHAVSPYSGQNGPPDQRPSF